MVYTMVKTMVYTMVYTMATYLCIAPGRTSRNARFFVKNAENCQYVSVCFILTIKFDGFRA